MLREGGRCPARWLTAPERGVAPGGELKRVCTARRGFHSLEGLRLGLKPSRV